MRGAGSCGAVRGAKVLLVGKTGSLLDDRAFNAALTHFEGGDARRGVGRRERRGRVTPEMTDADVNDVIVHALPRWMGLKYEIDALRRDWLLEKNAR